MVVWSGPSSRPTGRFFPHLEVDGWRSSDGRRTSADHVVIVELARSGWVGFAMRESYLNMRVSLCMCYANFDRARVGLS